MTPYGWLVKPLLMRLDPETAHRVALAALGTGLVRSGGPPDDEILAQRLWGLAFRNPIGIAAGFDKNAEVVVPLLRAGFGHVEAGTVTPRPQAGNPRPRVFRLPAQGAVINRLGFNNRGLDAMAARLAGQRDNIRRIGGIVGANIGCNRDTADEVADYVAGVRRLGGLADYIAINVSSPNTPGLRTLQRPERLRTLLAAVIAERNAGPGGHAPPLLLKLAPDFAPDELAGTVAAALDAGIDGLIVANTTLARPAELPPRLAAQAGGLSGRPLFAPSTALLARVHRLTGGRVPIIGVGGVASAEDAYAKIRAGASLVQLYTALVYHGPGLVRDLKEGLARLLRRDGFASVSDAVGTAAGNPGAG